MLPPQEALDSEQDQDVGVDDTNPQDIADLFDELSNLSESELELDTISVISTPKPKIRSVTNIVWKFVKKTEWCEFYFESNLKKDVSFRPHIGIIYSMNSLWKLC